MTSPASLLARWLGVTPEWPGQVVAESGDVILLRSNERDPVPPLIGCERLLVISDRPSWHADPRVIGWIGHGPFRRAPRIAHPAAREAIVHDLEHTSFLGVLALLHAGVERVHFVHAGGASFLARRTAAIAVGSWCSARAALRRILGGRGRPIAVGGWVLAPASPSRIAVRRVLAQAIRIERHGRARRPTTPTPSPRVVHYISDLAAGGAQRQLVELVRAQVAAGTDVTVHTALAIGGATAHFAPALESLGVSVSSPTRAARLAPRVDLRGALPDWPESLVTALLDHPAQRRLAWLVRALSARPADVLHCWLDEPNAVGALAGLASGTRRIVLSTRSLSPRVSPTFAKTWFRASYRLAAHAAPVRLAANSKAGAADYARWAGVDPSHFALVPNGIDLRRFEPASAAERARVRAELGIEEGGFLVVGILRLSVEKRPLDFVDAVAKLRARVPDARAIHIGTGPEETEVRARATAHGLGRELVFLGAASSPEQVLAAADACLLTSEFEGCPNVVLEALALGVPAVASDGGGSPEVVREGETGFVCRVGDVDAMAERLAVLAREPERRAAMSRAGRLDIEERFSIATSVARTLALYE